MIALRSVSALLLTSLFAVPAAAQQTWPSQPIRFIQGFNAGGNPDVVARLIAQPMSEMLGQPVVVEGRVGGGGVLAASSVAAARGDGHTIWLMPAGFAASVGLHKQLPYNPREDFTFLSMVTKIAYVIAVKPDSPIKTMQDLVREAKAQPGRIHFGTGGVGTGIHLTMELFLARAGLQMEHVPYRGGTSQVQALLSGEIPVLVDTPTPIVAQVDAGTIKPLAISAKQRWSRWPTVPTLHETVLPDFEINGWLGVGAPKGLPEPIARRLSETIHAAVRRPEVAERLGALATDIWLTTPAETRTIVLNEIALWSQVIRDAKIPQIE
jgi:tripartite-type tricarboxylate transporter receptor subunit TctC